MVEALHILFIDHQGHPAPLTECFYATASRRLSSTLNDRYPPSTRTEVDSAYCPHCLSYHDATSAAQKTFCPKPTCQKCPLCITSPVSIVADEGSLRFRCFQCDWKSDLQTPLAGDDKVEWARAAEELGSLLTQERNKGKASIVEYSNTLSASWDASVAENTNRDRPIRKKADSGLSSIEILEKELKEKRDARYHVSSAPLPAPWIRKPVSEAENPSATPPTASDMASYSDLVRGFQSLNTCVDSQSLLPLPTMLRPRRSRRCRAELAEGRPGILLKPKLNPLEGDSSLRSGHGLWWRKKHALFESNLKLLLKVTNPTMDPVRLKLSPSQYKGEPSWEDPAIPHQSMSHVLVNTLHQTRLDIHVQDSLTWNATSVVELSSGQDRIVEMGMGIRRTPESVATWDGSSTSSEGMRLVAHDASSAWFEARFHITGEVSCPAFPFCLEIEVGDGLWDSSLTQGDGKGDLVSFDVLVCVVVG